MNIKEAKEQIKRAMIAYFSKDASGNYEIPMEQQRPVFLIGPPGIGKTAIMKQIADELDVGLVSYSMTHHTRQSALGLPFITAKEYNGVTYQVSEYTMSEIIASIYNHIEETGKKEGILFLDEINCVSETLAPSMLLFLQYKMFGGHQIPKGWIVVTAGNPPEYNKSVHNFDIVTMDRLKRISVEPDYQVWKEYAYRNQIHPSIITYLDIKKENFYRIESTVSGKQFVTARGWEDLSKMLQIYEKNELPVDLYLISQYLQFSEIARDFSSYYDLFQKYKSDYQIDRILAGDVSEEMKERAKKARFDERMALIGLFISSITADTKNVMQKQTAIQKTLNHLKQVKASLTAPAEASESAIQHFNEEKSHLRTEIRALDQQADRVQERLTNLFSFFEAVYPKGQELLILVTELTVNPHTSGFISQYGCDKYFKHNKELLFYERNKEIISKVDALELE